MTYKIVLADDEPNILWGMKEGIDWESLGFEIVGLANNGQEALDMVEKYTPDVLISDIKMPFMDGLQVAKEIKKQFLKTKVVLFSGFDDFEYAQKAIQYGVSDYLLKPIHVEELTQLLTKLYQSLTEELQAKMNQEKLLKKYNESLPLMKEHFFIQLLENQLPLDQIEKSLQEFSIQLDGPYYTILMLQLNQNQEMIHQLNATSFLLENISELCQYHVCHFYSQPVIILSLKQEKDVDSLLNYLSATNEYLYQKMNFNFYGGIGHLYQSMSDLYKAYQDAKRALEYSVVLKENYFFYINDIEKIEINPPYYFEKTQMNGLLQSLKELKKDLIQEEIRKIEQILQSQFSTFSQYQHYFLEVYFSLTNILHQYKITDSELNQTTDIIIDLLSYSTPQQLFQWLYDFVIQIHDAIHKKNIDSNSILAKQAKDYIDENYNDPELSVEKICDYLHVSASHFSFIFKKEFQISFVQYLTEKRIEKAVVLLQTTDYKTRVIGEMVGYLESNYFSYVFKKKMEVSPIQFRKMNQHG